MSLTSGLFLSGGRWPLFLIGFVVFAAGISACGGAPPPADDAPTPTRTLPPIAAGVASPGATAEAAALLRDARAALAADSMELAQSLGLEVAEDHPAARGSSEALWVVARASRALGDDALAADAAERFLGVLPSDHSLAPNVHLLLGESLVDLDRPADAVGTLLRIDSRANPSQRDRALALIRSATPELSFRELEDLTDPAVPVGDPGLLAPVVAEYALALHVRDRLDEARQQADRALDLASDGPETELARSVLDGAVTVERRSATRLGAILPSTGSPSEQQYAELITEGIRARLAAAERLGELPAILEIRDDSGNVQSLPPLISDLTSQEVLAIIGPLGNRTLEAAARARSRPVPIVSPTAPTLPEGSEAVYSLSGPDPGAAIALARYATSRGLDSAVVLHSRSRTSTFEAERFEEEYEQLGGAVLERLNYAPGSSFFEEPLEVVRERLPAALVLPIPAGDIELLAPQITYYGLDTLGVQLLGTEDWTEPEVFESVPARHLNGVVAATPQDAVWERFVEDYEETHQQTLRSRIPALGYDAAGLLLEAVATGARDPEELRRALESIENYPGATGLLSVRDGRIVRSYRLVRLRDGELIPAAPDLEPSPAGAEVNAP